EGQGSNQEDKSHPPGARTRSPGHTSKGHIKRRHDKCTDGAHRAHGGHRRCGNQQQFMEGRQQVRVAAIYARYSTDDQRPTSIEDQVRQCRFAAQEKGFTVDDKWVFADRAISGGDKGSAKRAAFRSLLDAIEARQVDVLFVDEVSRVARNQLDGGKLVHFVGTIGLRVVVVSDNIDSETDANWQMLWSLKLMVAVHQNQSTAKEVIRGMKGKRERGYMIAQP